MKNLKAEMLKQEVASEAVKTTCFLYDMEFISLMNVQKYFVNKPAFLCPVKTLHEKSVLCRIEINRKFNNFNPHRKMCQMFLCICKICKYLEYNIYCQAFLWGSHTEPLIIVISDRQSVPFWLLVSSINPLYY